MNTESIIKTLYPNGKEWNKSKHDIRHFTFGYPATMWTTNSGFMVFSAVEVMDNIEDIAIGPQYHISVSYLRGRCTRNQSRYVLKCFNMLDSEEDNHVKRGFVRNYFKPVADKFIGYKCPCVEKETAIKENKGDYIWRGIN